MADGFLGRWSQRKQDIRAGKPLAEPEITVTPVPVERKSPSLAATQASEATAIAEKPEIPLPTMQDVHQLTAESDFSPFVAKNVSSEVRNSAMKKLFTDPHYNVMDRLDIYIDDYSQPDPIPQAMLRQMVSAKFLNLFKDEEEAEAAAEKAALEVNKLKTMPSLGDDANIVSMQSVAQSSTENLPLGSSTDTPTLTSINTTHILGPNDDHTDLRLQQNHAAGPHKLGRGAE
ncbi:MAG: DUF3306 domain-containing protein [Burkholderiaceae bacterium]